MPEPRVVALTRPDPSANLAATEPGLVRILAVTDAEEAEKLDVHDLDSATRLAEINHLGPLNEKDAAALQSMCEGYGRMQREKFDSRKIDATDSGSLKKEATMLYSAVLAESAVDAVAKGSYLVLSQSDPQQLTLPGAELLSTGTMKDGQAVSISIIMSLDAYPRLQEVRTYLDDMQFFDDSEKARKFNSLPDAERAGLAARVRQILARETRTRADRDFLRETMGFNTRLREGGDLLYALPVR